MYKLFVIVLIALFATSCKFDKSGKTETAKTNTKAPQVDEYSAIFGGGPFYSADVGVINDLRTSGFSTIILWTLHISEDGSMNFNDKKLIDSDGNYIGDPEWKNRLKKLTEAPSSVKRIEIGVGAWGAKSWENIKTILANEGSGKDTKLYKSFQMLMKITGATAINYDDEVTFDVPSTVEFSLMLADMGYKVGLCPYNEVEYWKSVYEQVETKVPGTIDRVYLQCYAGGARNKPADWNQYFGDVKVSYGLWCRNGENCEGGDTPAEIEAKIKSEADNISGGFIWLYDDIVKCSVHGNTKTYGEAINNGLIPISN